MSEFGRRITAINWRQVSLLIGLCIVAAFAIAKITLDKEETHLGDVIPSRTPGPLVTLNTDESHKILPKDPLQFLNAAPDAPPGRLIYLASALLPDAKMSQEFFVLRGVGQSKANLDATLATHIPSYIPELFFEPQFMPDGKSIVFKVGWPYDNGIYQLYRYDLATRFLEPLGIKGRYSKLMVSPDGARIAYYAGGDNEGHESMKGIAPLSLWVYDLNTEQRRLIANNPAALSAAWTQQGTLLFSQIDRRAWLRDWGNSEFGPLGIELKPSASSDGKKIQPTRPDLYEMRPGRKAMRLLHDAYWPVPSPDGKFIAYISSVNPAKKEIMPTVFREEGPTPAFLCLYERATRKQSLLRANVPSNCEARWTPDSKKIVFLENSQRGSITDGNVRMVDAANAIVQDVEMLQATDTKMPPNTGRGTPAFNALQVSHDGRFLFVKSNEITGLENNGVADVVFKLLAVNLSNGQIVPIAKIYNWRNTSLGMDWLDQSKSATINR